MAKAKEAPDAWAGVSPEYQNYASDTEKPLAGSDDEALLELPEQSVPVKTVNPDGSEVTPTGLGYQPVE